MSVVLLPVCGVLAGAEEDEVERAAAGVLEPGEEEPRMSDI